MRKPVRSPAIGPLILLAAVLWSGEMVRRDLWTPDEVRYAYVAREMAKDGHWLVPHRSGEYYAHKPPLLFWLINLGSRITRLPIGPVTSRLPGFFSGILVLWITARLAGRWRGPGAAWPAVLVLCTNYLFWHEVGFGRTDALLLGCSLSALYLLVRNDEAPAGWRPVLAYAAMGLGILTKGPVGFLVPVGAYIAMRLAAGEGRLLKKGHWGWGPLVTLSFPALWLGLAWWTGAPEGFLNEVLFKQNVARAAGELGHEHPGYYVFTHLPVDVTFVDEANDVRFFSSPKDRIFERTPDVIGRNVMNCHHPDSVQLVFKILEEFRAGTRDTAEFWIQTKPQGQESRFIHIQYFAVRDAQGKFRGTLEVTQDATDIRKLQGERRLLDEQGADA